MSQELDTIDLTLEFDPQYQNNLFIIEEALQTTGVLPNTKKQWPSIYDDKLRNLIDSVPLE